MPRKTHSFVPARPTHGPVPSISTMTKQRPVMSQHSSGEHLSTFFGLVLLCFSCLFLCRSIHSLKTLALYFSLPLRGQHCNPIAWGNWCLDLWEVSEGGYHPGCYQRRILTCPPSPRPLTWPGPLTTMKIGFHYQQKKKVSLIWFYQVFSYVGQNSELAKKN